MKFKDILHFGMERVNVIQEFASTLVFTEIKSVLPKPNRIFVWKHIYRSVKTVFTEKKLIKQFELNTLTELATHIDGRNLFITKF